jgi:hypothetical protein
LAEEPLRQILAGTRAILYFDARADAGLARAVRDGQPTIFMSIIFLSPTRSTG